MIIPEKQKVEAAPPLSPEQLQAYRDQLRNAKPPIPGMTWEQYRDYRSWRIHLQIVASQFASYHKTTGGEKFFWKTRLLEAVKGANLQATKFPPQGLPQDVVQPAGVDFLVQDNQRDYWLVKLIQHLEKEFANEIVLNIPISEET